MNSETTQARIVAVLRPGTRFTRTAPGSLVELTAEELAQLKPTKKEGVLGMPNPNAIPGGPSFLWLVTMEEAK